MLTFRFIIVLGLHRKEDIWCLKLADTATVQDRRFLGNFCFLYLKTNLSQNFLKNINQTLKLLGNFLRMQIDKVH